MYRLAEQAKPSASPEYYIFVLVLGFVACWGLYWYFRKGINDEPKGSSESGPGILTDDRERLIRIEETLKGFKEEYKHEIQELRSAFASIVRDRGDQMAQIGEIKGELKAIVKEISR